MIISRFESANEFFDKFSPIWLENEATSGVLYRIAKSDKPGMHYFAGLDGSGRTTLTACLHPSDQIVFSSSDVESTETLASFLVEQDLTVPGIFAPDPFSLAFAEHYTTKTGKHFEVVKQLGHYALKELEWRPLQTDLVRQATWADKSSLIEFRAASQSEGNTQRPIDPEKTVVQEIEAQTLYLLEVPDGEVVCTGSLQWDRSPRSGYVDNVYTATEHRQKGHATCLVHALSSLILKKNLVARLSVDLENLPAIAVYEKLGFNKDCQMDNLRQVSVS